MKRHKTQDSIHEKHYGDVVVRRNAPAPTSLKSKIKRKSNSPWYRLAGVVALTVVLVVAVTGRARNVNLHATNCLGDWSRTHLAEGLPSTVRSDLLTEANATFLSEEGADLFCGDFLGVVPEDVLPEQAVLHIAWSVDGSRSEDVHEYETVQLDESTVNEEQEEVIEDERVDEEITELEEGDVEVVAISTETHEEIGTTTEAVNEIVDSGELSQEEVSQEDEIDIDTASEDNTEESDAAQTENTGTNEQNEEVETEENVQEVIEEVVEEKSDVTAWFGVMKAHAQTTTQATTSTAQKPNEVLRVSYTIDNDDWHELVVLDRDMSGEVVIDLPLDTWESIADMQVLIQGEDGITGHDEVYIDALWVSVDYGGVEGLLDAQALREERYIERLPRVALDEEDIVRTEAPVFGAHELAVVTVDFDELPRRRSDVPELEIKERIPILPDQPQIIIPDEPEVHVGNDSKAMIEEPLSLLEMLFWKPIVVFAQSTGAVAGSVVSPIEGQEESVEEVMDSAEEVTTPKTEGVLDESVEVFDETEGEADVVSEEDIATTTNTDTNDTNTMSPQVVAPSISSGGGSVSRAAEEEEIVITETRIVGATLIDPDHNRVAVTPEVEAVRDVATVFVPQPKRFLPGYYTLELEIVKGDAVYVVTEEFLWGVLAVNMDRSEYTLEEEVYVQVAALDRKGHTICDADLTLEIVGPNEYNSVHTTADGSFQVSRECGSNNVTDTPDYFTVLKNITDEGRYGVTLTNNETGAQVSDSFFVNDNRSFDVRREGATRINPFRSTYEMEITVESEETIDTTIVERVPASFEIVRHNADAIETTSDYQLLVWEVDFAEGASVNLEYEYQAPRITPELFVLGPLTIRESTSILDSLFGAEEITLFSERRQWQLASDAAGDDFRVIRGSTVIADTATVATITEGVDYNLETGVTINDAFIRITNTRLMGMGDTVDGDTQNLDDFTARISNPQNLLTSITFQRVGTANPNRIEWEIIQYIGSVGGSNEIVVREQEAVQTNNTTVNGSNITTISTSTRVAVFITGQATNNTANTAWNAAQFTSDLGTVGMNFRGEFTRGVNTDTGALSYAVVEFTGSNWRDITRDEFTSNGHGATAWTTAAPTNSGTQTIGTPLLDASKAFLHVQYRNSNGGTQGLDDSGENVELTTSTSTYTTRRKTVTGGANKSLVVWVIENTQSDAGAMKVEHVSFYDSSIDSGTEETVTTQSITTVDAENNTSIMGESASTDGTGTAYPRGSINLRLTADDEVTYTESDDGQEHRISFSVVQWPWEVTTAVTEQNHFRWRDDSTALNTSGGYIAAEDINPSSINRLTTYRLRLEAANTGAASESASRQYELQFADKIGAASCGAVASTTWAGIADSGTDAFEMVDSTNITSDGQAITTSLLTTPGGYTFVNGEGRDVTDTSGSIGPLTNTQFTELEYSFQATEDAITGHTYCFRLYDSASSTPLDFYSAYPEVVLGNTMGSTVVIGEAGTVTAGANGAWTIINFTNMNTYATPIVVGTTNASVGNAGTDVDNAVVFEVRNVTTNSAEVRLCESDGDFADGCATHAAETAGYLVIDAAAVTNVAGIEAGTFDVSGRFNDTNVAVTYDETFTTQPQVFGAVQAASGTSPIDFRAINLSATGFTGGICEPGTTDDICEPTHGTEQVGWVAIEPGNEPFIEQSESGSINSVSGGGWASDTFATAFGVAPIVLAEIQGEGGAQDHEIDEVRSVTGAGFDTRSCEIDGPDLCDGHGVDTIAWFAVESGSLSASSTVGYDQMGFRWYENADSTTPGGAEAAENFSATSTVIGDLHRLRVDVQVGADIATSSLGIKLQYAERSATGTCGAISTWSDVGTTTSSSVWRGYNNASVADGASLPTSLLNGAANTQQTYEEENAATKTPTFIVDGDRGEWDFVLENNGASGATSTTYCFRVTTDAGGEINYTRYAELIVLPSVVPVASSVVVNNGSSTIILTENATTSVSCMGTVTDVNGYMDIATVTADIYRTSVGTSSALNDQNHYRLAGDSQCIPSNGTSTTEDYTCTYAFQYFADPTDVGSPYAGEEWTCLLTPTDFTSSPATGTVATDTIEVASLLALDVTSPIDYGTLDPATDTGATNTQITVTNTGNVDMDPQLSGDPMVNGSNTIAPGEQQYASTTFTYGAETPLGATTSPMSINLTLPQPTSTASVTAPLYWGINIPAGTAQGTYTGTNFINAVLGL